MEVHVGLFCHEHVDAFMEVYLDEADLGRIALSSHFVLGIVCDKTVIHFSVESSIRHNFPWSEPS